MNSTNLSEQELEGILGGGDAASFVYDLGRVIRFIGISGGGMYAGQAVVDWMGTSLANQASAK